MARLCLVPVITAMSPVCQVGSKVMLEIRKPSGTGSSRASRQPPTVQIGLWVTAARTWVPTTLAVAWTAPSLVGLVCTPVTTC